MGFCFGSSSSLLTLRQAVPALWKKDFPSLGVLGAWSGLLEVSTAGREDCRVLEGVMKVGGGGGSSPHLPLLGGRHGVPGIKPGPHACWAYAVPLVLSLQPQRVDFLKKFLVHTWCLGLTPSLVLREHSW